MLFIIIRYLFEYELSLASSNICSYLNTDEIGLPDHNLWYFNGYDLDDAFDKYFANPTEVRPPTVYIGFPCTKVSFLVTH